VIHGKQGSLSMKKILAIALVEDYSSEYETQITLHVDSGTDSIFHFITLLPPIKDKKANVK